MNQINLLGYVGFDPVLKQSQKQMSYVQFSLGVQRIGKKGEYDFFNCTIFDKSAEAFAKNIKKGDKILVTGHVRVNQHEKNGEKKTSYSVNVVSFYFTTQSKNKEKTESKDTSFLDDENFY